MKKILLTLLLLLGATTVAQAQETADMVPTNFWKTTTTAYSEGTYESPVTGIKYKIYAATVNNKNAAVNGYFQQTGKNKNCYFTIVENPNNLTIDKVELVGIMTDLNDNTKSPSADNFTAMASDQPLTITEGFDEDGKANANATISGGKNVVYDATNDCFEPDNKYFAFALKAGGAHYYKSIKITYQEEVDERTEVLLLYEPDELVLNLGEEFTAPGLKATIDDVDFTDDILDYIEYSSDNPELLDVLDDGTMVLSHNINDVLGTATITATLKENDTFRARPAVFTLQVVSPGNGIEKFDVDTDENYQHETNVSSINGDVVSLSFAKNNGTTAPRYWTSSNDKAVRMYANNTMTVTVPKGYVLVSATATPALSANFTASTGRYNGIWEAKDADGNDIETNTVTFTATKSYVGKTIIVRYKSDTEVVGFEHNLVGHGTYATLNYTIYINRHDDDLDYYAVKLHIDEDGHYSSEQHEIREYEQPQGAMMRVSPAEGKTYTHIATGVITTDNINNTGAPKTHDFEVSLSHNGVTLDEHTFNNTDKNKYNIELTTSGDPNLTGIEEVSAEGAAAAEYFTLQGVRVAEPQAGSIYLVRRAGKVEKQLVK